MSKDFKPIINTPSKKKNSLNQKTVDIKGKSDFSRNKLETNNVAAQKDKNTSPKNKELKKDDKIVDSRFKATLTQKISPSVNLKMNTLKPFLGELENMPKATINEIIDLMVDSYVNARLTTRQQEAFHSMYDTQLSMMKK
ncbi:hypothetical protein [Enterococcus faecium]|uniref:hypothetical protein n=1 Tax=Enterococcus faecium TaxID=1352 RepID=UPI000BF22714|nr:hypothetical protein [Enterococcus faecium]PEH49457.1 hypothetical protein CRM75_01430 [Enterococcus faecium]